MKVYLNLKVPKRLIVLLEKKDLPAYGRAFAWVMVATGAAVAASVLWVAACFGLSLLK